MEKMIFLENRKASIEDFIIVPLIKIELIR